METNRPLVNGRADGDVNEWRRLEEIFVTGALLFGLLMLAFAVIAMFIGKTYGRAAL